MKSTTVIAAVVAAGAAGFSIQAAADIYLGAAVGEAGVEASENIEGFEFDFDESDTAYKIFGGYRFNDYVGVELAYLDMGSPSETFGVEGESVELTADLSGFTAQVVGSLPLGPVDLFAKVGVLAWDADLEVELVGAGLRESVGDDDVDLAYAVGARFNFGSFGVRAEYERFDIGGVDDVDMLSVGVELRF